METSHISERRAQEQAAERRKMSHGGLLDSAIRMVAQLSASGELHTRTLANRAMADLQKLRHEMPKRRQTDGKTRPSLR